MVNRADVYAAAIKTYYCPTRRSAQGYNGNAGSQFVNGTSTDGSAGSGVNSSGQPVETNLHDGLVLRSNVAPVRLAVPDGTSNTLLVAEKWLHPQRVAVVGATGADGGDNEVWCNAGLDECVFRVGGGTYSYSYTAGGGCGPGTTTRVIPARRSPAATPRASPTPPAASRPSGTSSSAVRTPAG